MTSIFFGEAGGAASTSAPTEPDLDLLLVGHLTVDHIYIAPSEQGHQEIDDSYRQATGGAVLYGSLPAARLGARVGVLTKVAPADRHRLAAMTDAGVRVTALDSPHTTTFNIHTKSADLERRRFKVGPVATPFCAGDLDGLRAQVVAVCPLMRGELPAELVALLARRAAVALDVQGFIRVRQGDTLRSDPWPDRAEVLAHVTTLKADRRECEILTGLTDMDAAARELARLGPREVLVTHSGGILLHAHGATHRAALTPRRITGRTGRGDTALAAYLARRRVDGPAEALRWAAALVSCKLEQPGPFRGTLAQVQTRLEPG